MPSEIHDDATKLIVDARRTLVEKGLMTAIGCASKVERRKSVQAHLRQAADWKVAEDTLQPTVGVRALAALRLR